MSTERVTLTPKPIFCVKSLVQPTNTKIFLNIAWDPLIPPPPTGTTPEAISHPDYVIPMIIGDVKNDTDRKGAKSLVVDCIFSKELKSKALRDPDFKQFLSLVAIEHVEEKHNLTLSRKLASPNILSKGQLEPRSVVIPAVNVASTSTATQGTESTQEPTKKKPLIEEIPTTTQEPTLPPSKVDPAASEKPSWSIANDSSGVICITVEMPKMTRELAESTLIDVEPRRLILSVGTPPMYQLDEEFPQVDRDFHVKTARAEWHAANNRFVVLL